MEELSKQSLWTKQAAELTTVEQLKVAVVVSVGTAAATLAFWGVIGAGIQAANYFKTRKLEKDFEESNK